MTDEQPDDYNREAVAYITAALNYLCNAKSYLNHDRAPIVKQQLREAREALHDAIAEISEWEQSLG